MNALAPLQSSEEFEVIQRTGKMLALSGYFEARGDATTQIAQMATKVLAGRELGFGPFASVNGIHIIKGKPSVSANLMAAAVKGHPRYDYRVRKLDNSECSIEFFERVGDKRESIGISTFTAQDAQAAGTQNMDKFARNMLFARAMSNGVRWYTPDVFSGNSVYVPEELGADVDGDGNVVDGSWQVAESRQDTQQTPKPTQPPTQPANGSQSAATLPTATAAETFGEEQPQQGGTLDTFNALGQDIYGDQWVEVCARNVGRISGGKTQDSGQLTPDQIQKLIDGMTKIKSKRQPA